MNLNKKLVRFFLLLHLFIGTLYALEIDKIQVEYIKFEKISILNLAGFISNEYNVNISIHPLYQNNLISVHLQNGTLKELLDLISMQSALIYVVEDQWIKFIPKKELVENRFFEGNFYKEGVLIQYASLNDAIKFLQDVMPGQTILYSSTNNTPYSNLFNAYKGLSVNSFKNATESELSIYPEVNNQKASQIATTSDSATTNSSMNMQLIQDENRYVPRDVLYLVPYLNENFIYLVSSNKKLIEEAKSLLQKIDRPLKQVLIQAEIMELTLGDDFNSIFDFSIKSSELAAITGDSLSPVGFGNLTYSFLNSKLQANINIAKRDGRISSVSSPLILSMNRVTSNLDLTEEVYVVTGIEKGSVTTNEGGSIVIPPTPIYEKQQLGTKFGITPYINQNDEILLKVEATVASLSGNTQTIVLPMANGLTQSYTVDSISKYSIDSLLMTSNKKSIVLGGLIRESVSFTEEKTPILGNIPLLGTLFRKTNDKKEKKELIMILTPTVIDIKNPNELQTRKDAHEKLDSRKLIKDAFFTEEIKENAAPQEDNSLNQEIREFLKK